MQKNTDMDLNSNQLTISAQIASSAVSGNDVNPGVPVVLASLMVDQSAQETGGWTSNFFKNNNNCFGYSCDPSSDWQNGCSTNKADNGVTVGNYDTIDDSVQELVDYWYRRAKDGRGGCPSDLNQITTPQQYATILKNAGYYGDSLTNYLNGIKAWGAKIGDFVDDAATSAAENPGLTAAIGIGAVVLIFIFYKIFKFKK